MDTRRRYTYGELRAQILNLNITDTDNNHLRQTEPHRLFSNLLITFSFTKEPWTLTIYRITRAFHLKKTGIKPPTEAMVLGLNQTLFDP